MEVYGHRLNTLRHEMSALETRENQGSKNRRASAKKRAEALSFLYDSMSERAFRSREFPRTADAVLAVKMLYEAGAAEVYVEYDERDANHTNTLLVIGKSGSMERTFRALWSLKPDEMYYHREDRLWKLWWD